MDNSIYKDIIIDNYKNPMNRGSLPDANAEAEDANPLCGDKIKIELKLKDKKVADARFSGEGCAISTASASILTENIKGETIECILKINKEDILKLMNIELSPLRLKCALLPLKTVKLAIMKYL